MKLVDFFKVLCLHSDLNIWHIWFNYSLSARLVEIQWQSETRRELLQLRKTPLIETPQGVICEGSWGYAGSTSTLREMKNAAYGGRVRTSKEEPMGIVGRKLLSVRVTSAPRHCVSPRETRLPSSHLMQMLRSPGLVQARGARQARLKCDETEWSEPLGGLGSWLRPLCLLSQMIVYQIQVASFRSCCVKVKAFGSPSPQPQVFDSPPERCALPAQGKTTGDVSLLWASFRILHTSHSPL
ncbi:hypothetical protein Q8A67_022453 [Cirrhinus molitorella]|uniref:Uncharacterized protein n=1 Tax=Cirrhinus molitorella TaxID=172907 RepID=A0AA88P1S6_9TELE|nr:hypothetical protein Q8A67_022453 [Cirrhinus molitorella]